MFVHNDRQNCRCFKWTMAVDRLHATLLENDLEILKLDIYLGCGFLHFI